MPGADLAAFGDSLTPKLVEQLRLIYPTRNVFDGGFPGEPSQYILFKFQAYPEKTRTTVIWAGYNNFGDIASVTSDIASMVLALPHDRFVVIGIINGDVPAQYIGGTEYQAILRLNAALSATYGDRFIDARGALLAAADPARPQDVADVRNGVTPLSLRSDWLHLNESGSQVLAEKVRQRIHTAAW